MSLETWKEEFYPVEADNVALNDLAAAEHSLRKWEGMSAEAMQRHLVKLDTGNGFSPRVADDDGRLSLDSDSCALCVLNATRSTYDCTECVLCRVRDGAACDARMEDADEEPLEEESPYGLVREGNTAPMIEWLRKAVELARKEADGPEAAACRAALRGGEGAGK